MPSGRRGNVGDTTGRRDAKEGAVILLRRELGDVLREQRRAQGRTLREVSAAASVSLGYLSEVERGEKEASSELLAAICTALHLPLSEVLGHVSERVAETEALTAPVTLPVPTAAIVSASAA
jgi:transcriptional regulator with XRE-family HTH domain